MLVVIHTMAGLVLYSTNPWLATDVAARYRGGIHFAWVCEYFDSSRAPAGSAAALIAQSSNPKRIYETLHGDCRTEDGHSSLIKGYKKTFRSLARSWNAEGKISDEQTDEIIAIVNSNSWRIWRPVLYVIPAVGIDPARIKQVPRPGRAGHGPEMQIEDLRPEEFDIIELWTL
jgi:hypothetical protein